MTILVKLNTINQILFDLISKAIKARCYRPKAIDLKHGASIINRPILL